MKKKIEEFLDYELSTIPNNNYKKLFEKFKGIHTVPVSEWKKPEVLGYFCKKYFDHYQSNYVFKFNVPTPSKCFEVWQVSSLAGKLSADPLILKTYIDWAFQEVVPRAKRKLTSISFLNKEDTLTHYKMNVLQNTVQARLDRSSQLPSNIKEVFSKAGAAINTYGELAFIYKMSDVPENILSSINQIEQDGFNKSIIESIL